MREFANWPMITMVCYDIRGACASSMRPVGNCGEEPGFQGELRSTVARLRQEMDYVVKRSERLSHSGDLRTYRN